MDAVCRAGVRLTVNQAVLHSQGSSATERAQSGIFVTGTTPPAGRPVPKGAVVVLHETLPQGIEQLYATTTGCLAPVFQTTTVSAADQAAINAVAASPTWRTLAAQFPPTAEQETCKVLRTTPAPAARIPATCSTFVAGGHGLEIVSFTEGWGGPNPRRDDGSHSWSFLVQPRHAVEPGGSGGDPPRQVVG